jgi:hypothetical protein
LVGRSVLETADVDRRTLCDVTDGALSCCSSQ